MAVVNDFRSVKSVVDFKHLGDGRVILWDAFRVGAPHRGYQVESDCITIWRNYKLVCDTKSKDIARASLVQLLRECPAESRKCFAEHQHLLWDALGLREPEDDERVTRF